MTDGFVLAGGCSVRMGSDKARAPFPRRPMAALVAEVLATSCGRVALVRKGDDGLPWIDARGRPLEVVYDDAGDGDDPHPLWGVVAALEAARTPIVVIAPCDVPYLPPEAVAGLIAAAPAVAADGDRVHPLVAALPASFAARARQLASAGASARELVDGVTRLPLPSAWLRDVNRPEDLGVPSPVRSLLDGLPWLDATARRRVAIGEIGRLASLGSRDPGCPSLADGVSGQILPVPAPVGSVRGMDVGPPAASGAMTEMASETQPPSGARRGRVLVIDDEPLICEVIRLMLEEHHDVVTASSGLEARDILEADAGFDAILCDLMMKEMSGIELHAWLSEHAPDLAARMIFMTGGAFTRSAQQFLDSMPNPVISKPLVWAQVEKAVGDLVRAQPSI